MYVCLCKGITDRQIRQAVNSGAASYRAVRECLGVATQCGKCGCTARDIVRTALSDRPAPAAVVIFTPVVPVRAAAG